MIPASSCLARGMIMKRSSDGADSVKRGFSVVEGGARAAHAGASQPGAPKDGNGLLFGRCLGDLMLMVLGMLSHRASPDGHAAASPIDRYALDDCIDHLIADGSVASDPDAPLLHLTEKGRSESAFLLKAYYGFGSLLNHAAAFGLTPESAMPEAQGPVRAFKFRVDLDLGGLHPCWREIIVPAFLSFDVFHMAIQSAFLFADYHLYDFELRTRGELARISTPENIDEDVFFPLSSVSRTYDSSHIHLDDVFPKTRTARYAYDYGDGWEFKIRLVETMDAYEGPWPCCVRGAGDAPPEDVGGIGGFERFLRAISDSNHPDHEDLRAWGRMQLWEPFSLEAVNHRIAIWPTLEFEALWNEAHGEL